MITEFLSLLLAANYDSALAESANSAAMLRREQRLGLEDEAAGNPSPKAPHWPVKNRWMTLDESALEINPKRISIFCFAWVTRRPEDEKMLSVMKKQYAQCDGYKFFTDMNAPGADDPDIVKVPVPDQNCKENGCFPRNSSLWLYHKNMAGLLPAWTYLIQGNRLDNYDWVINSEFDHYMRPSMMRQGIETYVKSLWKGDQDEKASLGGPMMLMFGNVFLFSNEMVHEMRRQWSLLGKQVAPGTKVSGCPDWWGGKFTRIDCSQDELYVIMARGIMSPPVPAFGESGCGQPAKNKLGKEIMAQGLACWNMDQSPAGGNTEEDQLETIRAIAAGKQPRVQSSVLQQELLSSNRGAALVQQHAGVAEHEFGKAGERYPIAYPDSGIPVIHHVKFASAHELAQKLLPL